MQIVKLSLLFFAAGVMASPAAYADENSLFARQTDCGPTAGPCNENGCNGVNNPSTGGGMCTGNYNGCPCTSTCGQTNGACDANGCDGVNGVCTAGGANGCYCDTN